MHNSSLQNMQICYDKYVASDFINKKNSVSVLDVGALDVNGSYKMIFKHDKINYTGVDIVDGKGVDVILKDPYHYPFEDASMDVVMSGQTFEHCEFFWEAFMEMVRVLKPLGYIFLIAPSRGAIHRYPVDCYRFLPDSYAALAKYAHVDVVKVWQDRDREWGDLVGVFTKK